MSTDLGSNKVYKQSDGGCGNGSGNHEHEDRNEVNKGSCEDSSNDYTYASGNEPAVSPGSKGDPAARYVYVHFCFLFPFTKKCLFCL